MGGVDRVCPWRQSTDAYIHGFVQGTDFLPPSSAGHPGLLEELEGVARGSAQPWPWIYAYNLLDEEWTWARNQESGHCPWLHSRRVCA